MKNVLNKIAGWFQPAYDKIDKFEMPWLSAICKDMWDKLDGAMQKSIFGLATALYTKYGEEKAKSILTDLMAKLAKIIK